MSGLVVLFDMALSLRPNTDRFHDFVETAANLKALSNAEQKQIQCPTCLTAKFDTPSSLHKGIVSDPTTGSWLAAVGTVVDDRDGYSDSHLASLLKDYLGTGKSALGRCDGQFALVIYNNTEKSLTIVSDPAGLLSIYYGVYDERVFVSTSALAVAAQINAAPDLANVDFWLRTGRVLGEMTHWQGVERVVGGSVVKFGAGKKSISTYWSASIDQNVRKMTREDVLHYAHSILLHTFTRSLRGEGTVWAELTGGFDTRLVSMIAAEAGIPFISLSQGPDGHPDTRISRTLAEKKGWVYENFCLPDNWGTERLSWLTRAVGMADGHINAVPLTADIWGYSRRNELRIATSLTGGMGEIWRTSSWMSAVFRHAPASIFAADRSDEVKSQFQSRLDQIRSRYLEMPSSTEADALSGIYIYRGSSHEGAHLSAAMGQMRSIIPMALKDSLVCALSVSPQWRQGSKLVRSLLGTFDPLLASVETTQGGPAGPVRPNWEFAPYYWRNYLQKALGKILPPLRPPLPIAWSAAQPSQKLTWRLQLLRFAEDSDLLNPSKMFSGACYDPQQLSTFLAEAEKPTFAQETFLGRIITLELSMRAVNSRPEYRRSDCNI